MRTGFFRFFEAGEVRRHLRCTAITHLVRRGSSNAGRSQVVVRKWSNHTEDLLDESEMDMQQVERYTKGIVVDSRLDVQVHFILSMELDIKSFDKNLGAYPLAPPTNWQRWVSLSNYITKSLLHRIFPNNGIISHLPS